MRATVMIERLVAISMVLASLLFLSSMVAQKLERGCAPFKHLPLLEVAIFCCMWLVHDPARKDETTKPEIAMVERRTHA